MAFQFSYEEICAEVSKMIEGTCFEPIKYVNFQIDSKIHRYSVAGDKNGDRSGSYCLFNQDWPAGWFKNWRTGETQNWNFPPSKIQLEERKKDPDYERKVKEAQAKAEKRREELQRELEHKNQTAADEARRYFNRSDPCRPNIPYLEKKGVKAYGPIRADKYNPNIVIIPLFCFKNDESDFKNAAFLEISTLQFISETGQKRFLSGGKLSGSFFPFTTGPRELANDKDERPVLIGEGYATMATVYEATGLPCIAAMTSNNLEAVARLFKEKYPHRKFIIVADNDIKTEGNPGLTTARKIVQELNIEGLITPTFKKREHGTDWNDFMMLHGMPETIEQIAMRLKILLLPKYQQGIMSKVREISAEALRKKKFRPLMWAVEGFLPAGLSILCGGPKVGKSLMSLHIALAVALGGHAFGKIKCEAGDVLYLALEDTERRLQNRIANMAGNWDFENSDLSRLTFTTAVPKQHEGGAQYITWWLQDHPDARLIIIDTLQKFRRNFSGKGNIYAEDYETVAEIKSIADGYDVPILLIHHLKKGAAEDWLNEISGSQGIAGAADTLFSLKRSRGEHTATLARTGRDVEEAEFNMQLDQFGWTLLGEAGPVAAENWREELMNLIKSRGTLSANEYNEIKNISYDTARSRLRKLEAAKKIVKSGLRTYSLVQTDAEQPQDDTQKAARRYSKSRKTILEKPQQRRCQKMELTTMTTKI